MTELHPETFEEYHPGGPISSLRRLEVLYGAMTEAADGEIDSEYDLYHTPGELDGFVVQDDEDRYLVTLKIDVTGDDPELTGISADPLQPSDVDKLG
jgi:hypothetical protein